MKKFINLKTATIILSCVLVFISCKKDEEPVELILNESSVELYAGNNGEVTIETGNGGYAAFSSDESVATIAVSSSTITITAVSKGSATITVIDQEEKSETISITVKSTLIDSSTDRFKWDGTTINLNTANNWGHAILSDRVAITNISETKQYVLAWTGGFTEGDKTSATLKIAISGETTEEITLTNLEIQSVSDKGVYSVIFSSSTTSGELAFEN